MIMLRQARAVLTSAKLCLILLEGDIHFVSGLQFWEIVGSDQTELPGLVRSLHSNHAGLPICVTFAKFDQFTCSTHSPKTCVN